MTTARASGRGGFALVMLATAVSAASSFLVLMLVAGALGPAAYAQFSVFWGALFMLIAMLFGVQQEATRGVSAATSQAPREARGADPGTSVLKFAIWVAAVLALAIALTSPLWAGALFAGEGSNDRGEGATWGVPLAIGIAAYTLTAATNGVLAGTQRWGAFAALALLDGVLRFGLVAAVLIADLGATALAWAVALPLPIAYIVVLLVVWRHVVSQASVSLTTRELSANVGRTLLASSANALLVNGAPILLSVFARTDQATLGAVILAVTLTRAPILVPLTALQSMLIARFSADRSRANALLAKVVLVVVALTAVIAGVLGLWGAALLEFFFGAGFVLGPGLLAGLVAAAGCLGILTATGAGVLARDRHSWFAAGWVLAALTAVAMLALAPLELGTRTVLALSLGPVLGAVLHVAVLRIAVLARHADTSRAEGAPE